MTTLKSNITAGLNIDSDNVGNVVLLVGNSNIALRVETTEVIFPSKFIMPVGTTAERPVPAFLGEIRYNTDLLSLEGYNGNTWISLGS